MQTVLCGRRSLSRILERFGCLHPESEHGTQNGMASSHSMQGSSSLQYKNLQHEGVFEIVIDGSEGRIRSDICVNTDVFDSVIFR